VCGAPAQGLDLQGIDTTRETVIQGVVTADGTPVPNAYVRLLDGGGEFTAEVVSSATGHFRFFAAPGEWTVRALSSKGTDQAALRVDRGVNEVELALSG